MSTGFEKRKVADLRQELMDNYGYTEEDVAAIVGKSNLVFEIVKNQKENREQKITPVENGETVDEFIGRLVDNAEESSIMEELFEGIEPVEEAVVTHSHEDDVEEITIPTYGSKEWQDFIMSELEPDEIADGNPLCHGLRRLVEKYLGDIIFSGPEQVFPSQEPNHAGRATVVYKVVIAWKLGLEYMNLDSRELETRVFISVSDCWFGNSKPLFLAHPVATAETKAASRALKKALMLNVHTAEELDNDKDAASVVLEQHDSLFGKQSEWVGEQKISDIQKMHIVNMCERFDIDINKFMNIEYYCYNEDGHLEEPKYTDVDQLDKSTAKKMIEELNKYQTETGTKESCQIPKQILLEK